MHSFDQNTINSYYCNMKNTKEIIRFLLIGGLATAVDFLLMSLFIFAVCFDDFGGSLWQVFVSGKNIADTWVVVVGTGIGFLGGLIFNYIFSCIFVFENTKFAKTKKGFLTFASFSLIGLFIQLLGMYIGYDLMHINEWITKIVLTIVVLIFNYFTRKYIIFKGEVANEKR